VNAANPESDPAVSELIVVPELAKTRSSTLAANRSFSPSNRSSSPLPPLSDSDSDQAPIVHSPPRIIRNRIDSDSSSSDLSFARPYPRSMSTKSTAEVTHSSTNKPPSLSAGTVSPEVLRQFENACRSFFRNKEGLDAKDHVARIAGGLQDPLLADWYWTGQETFDALSFDDFMKELRNKWLPNDWEQDIRRRVLGTKQSGAFWEWAVKMRSLNTLLRGTTTHLDDAALLNQLEANLEPWLSRACDDERVKEDTLDKWLDKVKIIDEKKRRERQQQRADAEEAARSHLKRNTTSAGLTEPSRRYNTFRGAPTDKPWVNNRGKPFDATKTLPKLTDAERTLLFDNEGCLKCRRFFVDHRSANCPNEFPSGTNYKTLTSDDVKSARRKTSNPVASIAESSRGSGILPIAAIMPPTNDSAVLEGDSSDLSKDSDDSVSTHSVPFSIPHYRWKCAIDGADSLDRVNVDALIDNGSHTVLIRDDLVENLKLRRRKLHEPMNISLAVSDSENRVVTTLTDWVKLKLFDRNNLWSSRTVRAVVTPGLCTDVILGLPFLQVNKIVTDHSSKTCIAKECGYDLLNPPPTPEPKEPLMSLQEKHRDLRRSVKDQRKLLLRQLNSVGRARREKFDKECRTTSGTDVIAAIRERVEILADKAKLIERSDKLREEFKDIFDPLPHYDDLSDEIHCKINLIDASKTIKTRSYSCPRKYRDAWKTLIQQHLDAGRIRPSSSQYASPAFIVPKSDPTVLPRWVNDYRQMNTNTVTDSYPLPRVEDILADAGRGTIWSKMDMTNSFFHTRMHPDSIPLTAITTPFGLYEWMVMPMGLRNSPPVHQRRVANALRELIGKMCHIYLDDIIIWSNTIEEHERHVRMVLECLRKHGLRLNGKKSEFFSTEIDFLGHHISPRGIEANTSKVDKILNWPVPKSATDVRAFLGLVRYISVYLPKLAEFTSILSPLTTKEMDKQFPAWTPAHQAAFEAVKGLVVSRECLTVIDHLNPGDNKIFVTTDASDLRTGAVLSWGPTWEEARPVAFDSMQLNDAQKRYPVHEKELLAIIRALKKWRADLLGGPIAVFTDHRTLENFNTQKDLSRRQARWQEFMSQFEMNIYYVKGEDNTVADALSRLPVEQQLDEKDHPVPRHDAWLNKNSVNVTLSISADKSFLRDVKTGYLEDTFAKKLIAGTMIPGVHEENGLWYVGDRLVIPRTGSCREDLFRLAHDSMGHFGADKAYANIRSSYYWPNMRRDLESAYVPGCVDCQRNKSSTSKLKGPLHPLPIPDDRGTSVAIDFIGPLPEDEGFNCILTMTDRLGSDIRIIPTRTDISAETLASIFFKHWYCENGLPLDIISDRDKLFVSRFWKALHHLTGVKLKMSTAYHPQTDGSSERSNKTVNQCLRYHVQRNQKGWVAALPLIRFQIMNSVNGSTGYSGFQLLMGRSPRLIPPFLPPSNTDRTPELERATELIERIKWDVEDAKDHLLEAKCMQAFYANKDRGQEDVFKVGDKVMLSTLHRRREFTANDPSRVAKFIPRFDGPYNIVNSMPEFSAYTLDLPNSPNIFPTFHASQLKRFMENDGLLFPSREHARPGPIMTPEGLEEYAIERILDERRRGRGYQYLVRWVGHGPEEDRWLPRRELEECEALDVWINGGRGQG